jgi:hypothetical protein
MPLSSMWDAHERLVLISITEESILMVHVTGSKELWYRSNAFVGDAIISMQTLNMGTRTFILKCSYLTKKHGFYGA